MFLKFTQKGFSLVEIMVVITIIALLSIVSIGTLTTIQKNNRDAKRQADLRLIQGALQQYYADVNKYPNDLNSQLAAGGELNNCSGRATPCTTTKVYLTKFPKDPNGVAYYFRPVVSSTRLGDSCAVTGPTETGTCHFYVLCANLENSGTAGSCYNSITNNFQVTPL